MTRKCFVVCPIGSTGSKVRERSDDVLEFIIEPAMRDFNFSVLRADRLPTPGVITSQIVQLITAAEVIVADLTDSNANVFYELGIAHTLGKPTIHLAHDGERLPFDVQTSRTIFYKLSNPRRIQESVDALRKQLEAAIDGEFVDTPVTEILRLIELRKSADPLSQEVASIGRQLIELSAVAHRIQTLDIAQYQSLNTLLRAGFGHDHGIQSFPEIMTSQQLERTIPTIHTPEVERIIDTHRADERARRYEDKLEDETIVQSMREWLDPDDYPEDDE